MTRPLIFDAERERVKANIERFEAVRRAFRTSEAIGTLETRTEGECFEAVRTLRGALALEMVRAK